MKYNFICSDCKSDDVLADAYAEWDIDSQKWVISNTFSNSFCNSCEGETKLIKVKVTHEFMEVNND